MPSIHACPPLIALDDLSEMDKTQYWTQLRANFFCNCPDEYSYDHMHGVYTVYFGACPHRHGYNILGRIREVEVDEKRLDNLIKMANLGLKATQEPNH